MPTPGSRLEGLASSASPSNASADRASVATTTPRRALTVRPPSSATLPGATPVARTPAQGMRAALHKPKPARLGAGQSSILRLPKPIHQCHPKQPVKCFTHSPGLKTIAELMAHRTPASL